MRIPPPKQITHRRLGVGQVSAPLGWGLILKPGSHEPMRASNARTVSPGASWLLNHPHSSIFARALIGLADGFRFKGMQLIVAPESNVGCDSCEPLLPINAIFSHLRRTMPHLSATLRPDATFAECGGDSLDLVELCCAIDSDYGVRLTIDDFASVRTMFDLLSLIDQRAIRRPSDTSP